MIRDKKPSDIAYYLEDPSFLKWVVYNDEAEGEMWKEWAVNNPDYLSVMQEAKDFLAFFFQMDRELRAHIVDDKPKVWEKIQSTIQYLQNNDAETPLPKKRRRSYAAFVSVLSVILLLALGLGVYYQITSDKIQPQKAIQIKPGENNALVQWGNDQQVQLDSVPDGVMALQNLLGVKKFDNTIDYRSFENLNENKTVFHTITTPLGARYKIILSDGTIVWLNSNSVLKFPVPFSATRQVEISGECFFDVTHNSSRPFLVKYNDALVKVFGTQFNIKAYTEESFKVSLVKGKVSVANSKNEKVLQPGEEAVLTASRDIAVLHENNVEPSVAWKDGYFSFRNTSIEDVMTQLCKWYRFEVVYKESITEKFNGRIPMNTEIEKVFKILELTGSVKIDIDGNKVVVSKK